MPFVKDPNRTVNLNDTSKGTLGENSKKLGHYSESTGGGTPLKKGEKLKDHPEAKRVQQPRDEDGQFTYNSVNGLKLEYGPSRGTTVPPFLRGIKLTFFEPGTKLKIDGPDGIKVKLMTIDMSVDEIVNACKSYIESEEGFAGMGEGSSITKKGRKSKEEIEAKAGQIGHVDPKTLSAGTQKEMAKAKQKYEAKNSATEVNPTVGNFQVKTDVLNPDGTTKKIGERFHEWLRGNKANKFFAPKEQAKEEKPEEKEQVEATQAQKQTQNPQTDAEKASEMFGVDVEDENEPFDVDMAQNNPKDFVKKHKHSITDFISRYNEKNDGADLDINTVVAAIRKGMIKSPKDFEEILNG